MTTKLYGIKRLVFTEEYDSLWAVTPFGTFEIRPASEHSKEYLGATWNSVLYLWDTANEEYRKIGTMNSVEEAMYEANKMFASMASDVVNNYVVFYERDGVK